MSSQHTGNTQPSISQEEHDHLVNPATKRVLPYGYDGTNKNLFYVDTNGVSRSVVTIAHPISTTLSGSMTLYPSPNFIGLTTTVIGSAPTIFAVVNTSAAGQSSVVLDTGANWIGLATTTIGSAPTLYAVVNTSAAGTVNSLTTLLNSSSWIGLATTVVSSIPTIFGKTSIVDPTGAEMDLFKQGDNFAVGGDHGLMILSIDDGTPNKYQPLRSHTTIADNSSNDLPRLAVITSNKVYNGVGWDRLRTATAGNATTGPGILGAGLLGFDGTNYRRILTGTDGRWQGNVTVNNSLTFGSNVSLNASNAWIGLATVQVGNTINSNVSLSASGAWIGLATIVPDFGSEATVFTGTYSNPGSATIFIAPASNRFWLRTLHVASLGRSEVEFRSGATTLIPFTSLATTGGYVHDFTPPGLPSRAQADAFVYNSGAPSGATVSVMVSCYFRP